MIYKLIAIIILLLFSAFFSGSETALFSLNSLTLRKMDESGKNTKPIRFLLHNPIRLLSAVLIGNMLVNISASAIVAGIFINIWGERGVGIAIGIMTFLLLVFGEVTPKAFSIEKAPQVSLFVITPLIYFSRLIFPVYWCLHKVSDILLPVHKAKEPTLSEEELKQIVDIGEKEGVVTPPEKEMIKAILDFTDTKVQEVMTRRVDVRAVPIDLPQEDAVWLAIEFMHSKIPVYKKNLDVIMGFVSAKELFLNPEKPFTDIVRPILFVPETKKISEVLKIFEEQKLKIAIAVGEDGGTTGLVTMEDILEEIFGEIYDEFETPEELIKELGEGRCRVAGKAPVAYINKTLKLNLPEEGYGSIAGLIMDKLGRIPQEGEQVKVEGIDILVERMVVRRIASVIVTK